MNSRTCGRLPPAEDGGGCRAMRLGSPVLRVRRTWQTRRYRGESRPVTAACGVRRQRASQRPATPLWGDAALASGGAGRRVACVPGVVASASGCFRGRRGAPRQAKAGSPAAAGGLCPRTPQGAVTDARRGSSSCLGRARGSAMAGPRDKGLNRGGASEWRLDAGRYSADGW
jgi:hypothetical protein